MTDGPPRPSEGQQPLDHPRENLAVFDGYLEPGLVSVSGLADEPGETTADIYWRKDGRPADWEVAHPGIRGLVRSSYTELVYGKSRCVTYSSVTCPVAAAPLGLARTAVIDPSENPLIQLPA